MMIVTNDYDIRVIANSTPNIMFPDNLKIELISIMGLSGEHAMTRPTQSMEAVPERVDVIIDEIFDDHNDAWRRLADL